MVHLSLDAKKDDWKRKKVAVWQLVTTISLENGGIYQGPEQTYDRVTSFPPDQQKNWFTDLLVPG